MTETGREKERGGRGGGGGGFRETDRRTENRRLRI